MPARVLLLTGSPAHYMAPPRLGEEQVTGGPDWQDDRAADGRWASLKTPLGEYDVAPLLARLAPEQQPDVVACLVDASRRNLPRNLAAFRGPKVLLVADTHHLQSPLSTMLRYATSEPYDRVVLLYDRHHAALFHAAGLRNLFWFPGLTFPHDDAFVRQSRRPGPRAAQVAFVGQAGKLHPRRARLLAALAAAKLPLVQQALGQRDALPFYGSSLMGFNSSLNGDLNLRVFEILAAGGLLVTDRLAPSSGLEHLLTDGRNCLLYGDEEELVARVSDCLRRPSEAEKLAEAGARWFLDTLGERARREMFTALAFDGRAPAPFPLATAALSHLRFSDARDLLTNVLVYEGVQELHRLQDDVRVVIDRSAPENVARLCATLPRVNVAGDLGDGRVDLLVTGENNAASAAGSKAAHVWCWDAPVPHLTALTAIFSPRGYTAVSPELGFYSRQGSHEPLATADGQARQRIQHLSPASPAAANQLGTALRKTGRLLEGLGWQRRALGAANAIASVDPGAGPVRVAFILQHPQGWPSLESVWRAMEKDPAFAPFVIAAPYRHPYPTEGGADAIYAYLEAERIPFVRWDQFPLKPGFADVVFVQNPYDVTRPEPLRVPNLVKLVPRLAYVPYGLEIGGGAANAVNQHNQPLQQLAWAVFARSFRHKAMFGRHCSSGDAHVAVTGHPRLDILRNLGRLPLDPEFTAFARGRKIIFWNPQFDILADGTGYSTFLIWQDFLIRELARRQDLVLVIRPHPLFFGTLQARKLWSSAQVSAFLARVAAAGNILIDRRPSYLPVFAASDAMLSDASTFLLEYTGTGKPLLYLHNPRGPALNEDGAFVAAHAYSATCEADIVAFLDQTAAGEDPRRAARLAAYPEVMHAPPEGVGNAIKEHLLAKLTEEAAAARSEGQAPARLSA